MQSTDQDKDGAKLNIKQVNVKISEIEPKTLNGAIFLFFLSRIND